MTEILKVRHMGEILKSLQGGTFFIMSVVLTLVALIAMQCTCFI